MEVIYYILCIPLGIWLGFLGATFTSIFVKGFKYFSNKVMRWGVLLGAVISIPYHMLGVYILEFGGFSIFLLFVAAVTELSLIIYLCITLQPIQKDEDQIFFDKDKKIYKQCEKEIKSCQNEIEEIDAYLEKFDYELLYLSKEHGLSEERFNTIKENLDYAIPQKATLEERILNNECRKREILSKYIDVR